MLIIFKNKSYDKSFILCLNCNPFYKFIFRKTFRKREDVSRQQVDSLRSNPFLWSSYSSALRLGEKIDPNTVFLEKVCDIENMVDVQSAQLVVPVKTATISVQVYLNTVNGINFSLNQEQLYLYLNLSPL